LENVVEQQVLSASIEGVFAWCGLVSSMCSPLEESVGAAELLKRTSPNNPVDPLGACLSDGILDQRRQGARRLMSRETPNNVDS